MASGGVFTSLSLRTYRWWFFGNLVANTGTWMQRIAQDWLVLKILTQGSGLEVGIVTALQFAPSLLLGPYAGVIADRYDRRFVLQLTQVAAALLSLILGGLVVFGHVQLWHVYVLAFALGVVAAIESPPRNIFVSELVPGRLVSNAVALNSASFNAARMLGPAVAGVVIALVGPGWVFFVNAASYLGPIVSLIVIRPSDLLPSTHVKAEKGQVREGIRYVKNRTDIIVIMAIACIVSTFGLNYQLTMGVMATNVFHKGAGEFGLLGSIMAIGSVAGALNAARRRYPKVRNVIIASFAFGFFAIGAALAPSYWIFALALIPVGFSSLTMITSANAAIQLSVAPEVRGRVMSLYVMVFLGGTPLGSPLIGWVADNISPRWSIAIGGIASLLVAVWAALWTKHTWNVRLTYSLLPPRVRVEGPRERAQHIQDSQDSSDSSADQASNTAPSEKIIAEDDPPKTAEET
ncbi:MAG: MFS transporter [Actinomycetaceae bacterium]|nr:MFS transporter [Actinomycetaceae bacterium]